MPLPVNYDGKASRDKHTVREHRRAKTAMEALAPNLPAILLFSSTAMTKVCTIMSLLNLVHKSVIIKFADCSQSQFNPEASYAFRLTGVDAMGFLLIEDLKPGVSEELEINSAPYWINKDLVREIHELDLAKTKETLHYNGTITKSKAKAKAATEPATAKPAKAKAVAK